MLLNSSGDVLLVNYNYGYSKAVPKMIGVVFKVLGSLEIQYF